MVLMLEEADDPEAKLALPGSISPSLHTLTIDGHSESESSEDDNEQTSPLIAQDPPPSYIDVQSFRERIKEEERAEAISRAWRRFWLALALTCLFVTLSTSVCLAILYPFSSQNELPEEPEPTATATNDPRPPFPDHPPWRGPPGPGGGGPGGGGPGGGGPDRDRGPPPRFPDEGRQGPNRGHRPEFPPPDNSEGQWCSSTWLPNTDISAGQDASFATTYTFPLNNSLSIKSFLSHATGTLRISLDDQLQEDIGSIEVVASGIVQTDLKNVGACLVTNKERYFTSLSLKSKGSGAESAVYSIRIRFPSREAFYPGLITDLPRFSQSFDDLTPARFDFIDINGFNSDISSVSVLAKYIGVHTFNGTVDGHFSVAKGMDIMGDLKPITITSNICDDGWGSPTFTRIFSSRSPINAKITLCGHISGEDGGYGRYQLSVANRDSPISLQVEHEIPAQGSSLYLNVTNVEMDSPGISNTMITLDTGFEGNFELHADGRGAPPVSVHSEDASDDNGGTRRVEIEKTGNNNRSVRGKVFWDSPIPPFDRRESNVWINTFGSGEASLTLLGD